MIVSTQYWEHGSGKPWRNRNQPVYVRLQTHHNGVRDCALVDATTGAYVCPTNEAILRQSRLLEPEHPIYDLPNLQVSEGL